MLFKKSFHVDNDKIINVIFDDEKKDFEASIDYKLKSKSVEKPKEEKPKGEKPKEEKPTEETEEGLLI
jgi:hypothetical protein